MSMTYELVEQNLVVRLSGELDLVAAAEFKRVVEELLDRRSSRNLFVNLEQVTFLDSAFLGALLGRYRRVNQAGGRMGVIGTPATVRPTLELSGIFRTMEAFSTESEALGSGARAQR